MILLPVFLVLCVLFISYVVHDLRVRSRQRGMMLEFEWNLPGIFWNLVPKEFNHVCVSPDGTVLLCHKSPEWHDDTKCFSFKIGTVFGLPFIEIENAMVNHQNKPLIFDRATK